MATRADDLATIRRLSQYRPFEHGGASARETKEDLILAAIAEAGGRCTSISDCASTIETLWGLHYDALELADPINHLIAEQRVLRANDGGLSLSATEDRRLRAAAEASRNTARQALEQWHQEILARWPSTSQDEIKTLDTVLERFLRAMVMQHGAEAALLMFPEDPAVDALLAAPDAKAQALSGLSPAEFCDLAEWALSSFMRNSNDSQRAYLSEMLNTAYFVSSLTIDPECGRLIKEIAAGQRVYLDTNFVYRLLGVQGPRYIKTAEVILRATQAAGYVCAVTPWTVNEYRLSLERSKEYLQRYPVPPDEFASLAADVTSVEDFVTSYWRQVRQTQLSVTDYVAYHTEVEAHLTARGIAIVDEGVKAIDAQQAQVDAETTILVRVLAGKWRHPELVVHDVKHRMLVQRLRGAGNRTFANAGYWFLTHDRVLPRYDALAAKRSKETNPRLPFCVSAGAWFQVVEAFRPKTDDFAQTLSDVIASPYIHPRTAISKEAAQAVVARVALYKGGTPELAARVFMNSAAMAEIEAAADADTQTELIDNAIVAAAKDVHEEARQTREAAEQERTAAAQAMEGAQARVREEQQRSAAEVESLKRAAEEAARAEAARRDEAAKHDAERHRAAAERAAAAHDAELAQTRAALSAELQARETDLVNERAASARHRRRQRLAWSTSVAIVLFILAALAFGFDHAWQYVVAAGICLGILAAVDQLFARRDP